MARKLMQRPTGRSPSVSFCRVRRRKHPQGTDQDVLRAGLEAEAPEQIEVNLVGNGPGKEERGLSGDAA
jgi:hypothetical protein